MNAVTDDQADTDVEVIGVEFLDAPAVAVVAVQHINDIDIADLPAQRTQPYNPEKALDDARKNIAYLLIGLLIFVCGAAIVFTALDANTDSVFRVLEHILSPIIGLAGAATGFYFGTRSKT